ncbi:MAG: Ig-like domain-containing protein [Syntrophomonas sp.]
MRFKLGIVSVLSLLLLTGILATQALAGEYDDRGSISVGQEYSGAMNKNEYGNNIPVVSSLNIAENSMIKVRLYTQSEDSCLNIFNREPSESWEYPADTLTTINELYSNPVAMCSSNYFSVTADKRNDKPYVDMFANVSKGNYYVGLTGSSYRFQIDLEPLTYMDDESAVDIHNTNDKDYALSYSIGNYQEGQMLTNGEAHNILNQNNYYDYIDDDYDYFKFNVAAAGIYTINFYTDGFLGAGVFILDPSGWNDYGHKWIDAVPESADKYTAAYEDHRNSARAESMEFEIAQPGDYLVRISRTTWTAGSYKFRITGEKPGTELRNHYDYGEGLDLDTNKIYTYWQSNIPEGVQLDLHFIAQDYATNKPVFEGKCYYAGMDYDTENGIAPQDSDYIDFCEVFLNGYYWVKTDKTAYLIKVVDLDLSADIPTTNVETIKENAEASKDYNQEWKKTFPTYRQFKEIQTVEADYEFTVSFNNNVKSDELDGYIAIWDADLNQPLPVNVTPADAKILKVKASAALEHNKYYYLVIYEGLKSESGQTLKQGIVHVFKTI